MSTAPTPTTSAVGRNTSTSSATFSIALPAGLVDNQLLVLDFAQNGTASLSSITGGSGGTWTALQNLNGTNVRGNTYYRLATGSSDSSASISITVGANNLMAGIITVWPAGTTIGAEFAQQTNADSTTEAFPALTPLNSNYTGVGAIFQRVTASGSTAPTSTPGSGWTEINDRGTAVASANEAGVENKYKTFSGGYNVQFTPVNGTSSLSATQVAFTYYISPVPDAGTGSPTGAGVVTAAGVIDSTGATPTGAGVLSASGVISSTGSTPTGAGAVSATAIVVMAGTASPAGAGSLTATAVEIEGVSTPLTGTGSVSAPAVLLASSSPAGAGTLTAPAVTASGASSVGAGALTASGSLVLFGASSPAGAGQLTAAGVVIVEAVASFTGTSILTSSVTQLAAVDPITGHGNAESGIVLIPGPYTYIGAGQLTATAIVITSGFASISGAGACSGIPRVRIPFFTQWDGVSETTITLDGEWDGSVIHPLTFDGVAP